jgi:hypothetical protein
LGGRSPRERAPMIMRMVVQAKSGKALWPWGVSEMSTETLPWPEWERTLGWAEGVTEAITVRKARQSARRRKPVATKWTPLGGRAASDR